MNRIKIQKALALSFLFTGPLFADIHDRIEYKLNRVLKDVDVIINGNSGNCTPITQAVIDQAGGVYTIVTSGEYCVTQNITGLIVVDADCVCIDLECHVVNAGGNANAFVVNGQEGVRISNGCITNASDAAILLTNSTAVELSNLHMHDNNVDSIRATSVAHLNVHDVTFFNSNSGERALNFATCNNVDVNRCAASGFLSTVGAIVQLQTCTTVSIQDMDISNSTKSLAAANTSLSVSASLVHADTCTGISLQDVRVNNNTVNNTVAGNKFFNAIGFTSCASCDLTRCETSSNTNIAGAGASGQAFDRPLFIGLGTGFIVNEHQANNNRVTAPTTGLRMYNVFNSTSVILDGCQANNNFVATLTVDAAVTSQLNGFRLETNFTAPVVDNVIRNCQANFNVVQDGGVRVLGGIRGEIIGILTFGDMIIDNCQASDNTMVSNGTFVMGIGSVLNKSTMITNSVASNNIGGQFFAMGIALLPLNGRSDFNQKVVNCSANFNGRWGIAIGDFLVTGAATLKNVSIIDCEANNNGSATLNSAGIAVFGSSALIVENLLIKGCQINDTTSGGGNAAGIDILNATNVVIEDSNVFNTTAVGTGHGILFDTLDNSKIIRTQMHGNKNSGVELIRSNTCVAIIECVAMNNDIGFNFAPTSTASCCLVQDSRALSNRTAGFIHAAVAPLTTTYIGNEAQCNGVNAAANFVIGGGVISLYELAWDDGLMTNISGEPTISPWTNVRAVPS